MAVRLLTPFAAYIWKRHKEKNHKKLSLSLSADLWLCWQYTALISSINHCYLHHDNAFIYLLNKNKYIYNIALVTFFDRSNECCYSSIGTGSVRVHCNETFPSVAIKVTRSLLTAPKFTPCSFCRVHPPSDIWWWSKINSKLVIKSRIHGRKFFGRGEKQICSL